MKKKVHHGTESFRVRTDLLDRARAVNQKTGIPIKLVIERALDKNLPPLPLPPKK